MPDDLIHLSITQQEAQQLRALAEREQREQLTMQQHAIKVNKIVEVGQREFGHDRFDAAAQTVANTLGDRTQETMAVLKEFDAPHRHVVALADDPDRLKRFASLPVERQRAEIALAENRTAPFGYARSNADPAYLQPAFSGGRMSDQDWNSGSADLLSEREWQKQWETRQKERNERRGGRW
jgi:hypothetical protein